jgi:hypothetical protein
MHWVARSVLALLLAGALFAAAPLAQPVIPIRVTRMQQKAPRVPAALERAGIPYAFSFEGLQNPADFVRGVGRAVREGGKANFSATSHVSAVYSSMAGR